MFSSSDPSFRCEKVTRRLHQRNKSNIETFETRFHRLGEISGQKNLSMCTPLCFTYAKSFIKIGLTGKRRINATILYGDDIARVKE